MTVFDSSLMNCRLSLHASNEACREALPASVEHPLLAAPHMPTLVVLAVLLCP